MRLLFKIPTQRPTSQEILHRLEEMEVGMLRKVYPGDKDAALKKVRCMITLPATLDANKESDHTVLIFSGRQFQYNTYKVEYFLYIYLLNIYLLLYDVVFLKTVFWANFCVEVHPSPQKTIQ